MEVFYKDGSKAVGTREQIVAIISCEGYDMFTACEEADKCLEKFRAGNGKPQTYYVGRKSFVLKRVNRGRDIDQGFVVPPPRIRKRA